MEMKNKLTITLTAICSLSFTASHAQIIIQETFGGSGSALNGTTAEIFDAAIVTAGGSATWNANGNFLDNGTVNNGSDAGASLSLGSYVNDAKGTAGGKFELTYTVSQTTGAWISLGFSATAAPTAHFTSTEGAGLATIIYRGMNTAFGNLGELDMYAGPRTTGAVDGPDGNIGARTLTATIDFTPAGGYDGTTDFGTVTWSDSVLGDLGSAALPNSSFSSILISTSTTSGTISDLTLTQVPEPSAFGLLAGCFGFAWVMLRRR